MSQKAKNKIEKLTMLGLELWWGRGTIAPLARPISDSAIWLSLLLLKKKKLKEKKKDLITFIKV